MKMLFSIEAIKIEEYMKPDYRENELDRTKRKERLMTVKKIYENSSSVSNLRICFKNELNILDKSIKLLFPHISDHLESLSIPLMWYFYDSLLLFYTDLLPPPCLLRFLDILFLQSHFSNIRARQYLLALPLYLLKLNHDLILTLSDPLQIRLVLKQTPLTHMLEFAPFNLIENLAKITAEAFGSETPVAKILEEERKREDEKLL
jgi:hypothetical protein